MEKIVTFGFGRAMEIVDEGGLVERVSWNGIGQFVFKRPGDACDINSMMHFKSLPQAVKDYFARRTNPSLPDRLDGDTRIFFHPYLCLKNAQDSIINGWIPSMSDLQATDWVQVF